MCIRDRDQCKAMRETSRLSRGSRMGGNGRWAWPALFLAPQYLVSTVFLLAPIAAGVLFSFFRVSPVSISWLGFNNYRSIIHDSVFHGAFVNTILFMVVNVPLTLLLGLAVALVIHPLRPKYQSIFRITFYLPVLSLIHI